MHPRSTLRIAGILSALAAFAGCARTDNYSPLAAPYDLRKQPWESRSISFENPEGTKGGGGTAANHLGVGRKGMAMRPIAKGTSVTLCDIQGSGTIRHIWMTGDFNPKPHLLREIVVRAWWDGQEHPSIECPLGDFMGLAQSRVAPYESAVHSIGNNAALNIWLPMPFTSAARIEFANESGEDCMLYYQIDYTLGDKHPADVGRMHTLFRRENPTTLKKDFELLPKRTGKGRFIGAVMGVRYEDPQWWGEGEVKFFIDGDEEFPTICGTGSEDYICLSYGMQETTRLYHGCNLNRDALVGMYRWHLADPIVWSDDIRVTVQQIGWNNERKPEYVGGHYYERQDDWSTATFWYEPIPSEPLPKMPDLAARTANLRYSIGGDIRAKWMEHGGPTGPFGPPETGETPTPDGVGRFVHFRNGVSIYWTPSTGARMIQGDIRKHWAKLGWETSFLGYPTSDEYDVPVGRRSDFQHGTITWNRETNTVSIP